MATKLSAKQLPPGKSATDFQYRGRPAADQSDFGADVGLADLIAVDQAGQPEAKYYHGGVVQSSDGQWWVYLEWGRLRPGPSWTGDACSQDFQFVQGSDEADARAFFAKQIHSKNASRLVQKTINGQSIWASKGSSSGYRVVNPPTPDHGLPAPAAAAPAPAPAAPVVQADLLPFSAALEPLLAEVLAAPGREILDLDGMTVTAHGSAQLITLPSVAGPQTRLLLRARDLTLPDQQLSLQDIQAIDAQDALTITTAAGVVGVQVSLSPAQARWLVGTVRLAIARRRAARALLRQFGQAG